MSSRRTERVLPLLVNGGIDTKTNPKLVQHPALLELENMYQLRTGELRPRNGNSKLGPFSTLNIGNGENLFVTPLGGLATISRGWQGNAAPWPVALKLGLLTDSTFPGWAPTGGGYAFTRSSIHPWIVANVTAARSNQSTTGTSAAQNIGDPDAAISSLSIRVAGFTGAAQAKSDATELATGRSDFGQFVLSSIGALVVGAPTKLSATGTGSHVCSFGQTGTNALTARRFDASGTALGNLAIAADLAASGFYDVKPIPGQAKIAVAYAVNGGGIKCGILDPAAGTFASVVTTAGGDATQCMGWLDDQLSTGNMYLATAGTTSGVVVRTMSPTTMVVSATNVIDATATANVRNVTGHINASATDYVVLWDIAGSSAIYDKVRLGQWTGSAAVRDHYGNHSLYSRSFQAADGRYYVVGCLTSQTQPLYTLISIDGHASAFPYGLPACTALSGEAGVRRSACALASAVVSGSTVTIPVMRRRKITTPDGGSSAQSASVAYLSFTVSRKVTKARELGGTVFIPGGLLSRDDGIVIDPAGFPIYPEPPTGASAAGGSMTPSGTYLYRVVFKRLDATSRISRSAGSTVLSITLGAADTQVTLSCFNLKALIGSYVPISGGLSGSVSAEIYRRGPTAAGGTLYNKVGEFWMDNTGGGDTFSFVDQMSDANAAAGEVAYFNGNVLENFAPPSCSLLEVNGNRVGIVNAEDPSEFWFSKEYKAGAGIAFYPDNKVRISGDGAGGLTALAALDGRWILFKRSAIYVLSGDGPNDLGQGSFNAPQAVSRNLGTVNPASVIETPDGIMFEALNQGIWLLDRGLNLQYVGAPVEQYTLAEDVAGAAAVTGLPTVRFVLPSGRMLEWDYFHKRWYTHQLRVDRSGSASTVVDCANSPIFGWCYLLANGDLMQEVAGSTSDTNGTTTGIVPRIGFPVLQLASLAGYQRFKGVDLTLDVLGTFTASVDAEYNYSGALTGTPKTIALTTATPTAQVEYNPPDGKAKCTAVRLVLTVTGSPTGGTFRLTGATATVAIKRGSNIPDASRMA